jgi:hypothetical protein
LVVWGYKIGKEDLRIWVEKNLKYNVKINKNTTNNKNKGKNIRIIYAKMRIMNDIKYSFFFLFIFFSVL